MTLPGASPLHVFADRPSLVASAASALEAALRQGLERRGSASLIASGGSTPGPVYERLSQAALDFSRVSVGLADERFVPEHDPASNFALIRRSFASGPGAQARLVPLYCDLMSPAQAATAADTAMADLVADMDALVLGMGPDGHTLSWFPGAGGLRDAMDPASPARVSVIDALPSAVTGPNTTRLTLTASAVARARHALLLITGEEKRAIWCDPARPHPVHALIPLLGNRLSVYWAP